MTLLSILIVWAIVHYSIFRPRIDIFDRYWVWANTKMHRWVALIFPLLILAIIFYKLRHFPLIYFITNIIVLWYGWIYSEESPVGAFSKPLNLFTLLFWYVLLGPIGVLLYDFMRREHFSERHFLEWPSARVLAFGYALAGHFPPTFTYWSGNLFKSISNTAFLENCGVIALQAELGNPQIAVNDIKALIKRAQIMLLIVLVIYFVGKQL